MVKTLLVEDDVATRRLIESVLQSRGHAVTACGDAESAWEIYQRDPHPLVVLDWLLPGMDGLELCRRMRLSPAGAQSVIVVSTGRDQAQDLTAVLDAGADDYLTKPIDVRLLNVRLAIAERHVHLLGERQRAEADARNLRKLLNAKARLEDLIGKSAGMQQVFQLIRDLAPVDTTVLIEGETGTGKELVARAIHSLSERRSRPFVAVNCAGLTESLVASQLFGHRRGAFTGAIEDHKGYFETANGGTIFLDEIGDLPASVQVALLRVLQEREIVRLGESTPRKIDVRVLTATHRRLADEVKKGNFRVDLLYRIRVARIGIPPLHERREDIPILAQHFLAEHSASCGKQVDEISTEAMRMLIGYDWPGNVRELQSAIEFAVVRCQRDVLEPGDLPPEVLDSSGSLPADTAPVARIEEGAITRGEILEALRRCGGNRTRAAKRLGISRATLYRRLDEMESSGPEPVSES